MKNDMLNFYLNELSLIDKFSREQNHNFLSEIRRESQAKLNEIKFPTIKNEEWKYTDVSPILSKAFKPTILDEHFKKDYSYLKALLEDEEENILMVFVNGNFVNELSSIGEVSNKIHIGNLSNSFKTDETFISKHYSKYLKVTDGFLALNTAFSKEGAFINLVDNQIIEKLIHIVYINGWNVENALIQPRNLIVIGKNSKAKIIETNIGINSSNYFFNSATEIYLEENSALEHYKVQNDSLTSFNISKTQVVQLANSSYNSVTVTIGGSITRNDLNTKLDGEGAECNLTGLYFVSGEQHVDNHTLIEHAAPNCHSNELYKGILGGKSRGVFNGKVFVKRDAQKTNAYQSNKNILLSRDARINTKPQLEIFADDVKCTHGATVGQIDDEALFYLQSRGIDRNSAMSLLIYGFANDVLEYITIDTFKDKLDKLISAKVNFELQKK